MLAACVETTDPVLILDAPATVVHAAAGAPPLNVMIDDRLRTRVSYGQSTDRFAVRVGPRHIRVFGDGVGSPLDAEITIRVNAQHTIIAAGRASSIQTWVLVDDAIPPDAGIAHVRIVHAAIDAGAVDVYITQSAVALPTVAPRMAAVVFGGISDYTPVDAAVYRIRVTEAGTQTVIADLRDIELGSRRVCTLVIIERTARTPQAMIVLDG